MRRTRFNSQHTVTCHMSHLPKVLDVNVSVEDAVAALSAVGRVLVAVHHTHGADRGRVGQALHHTLLCSRIC
jgi:crotonobetainyl-CoA:carnitine CoA-transferase CaiB-like acyl-CoA transferase